MEHETAWKKYDEADLEALEHLAAEYIDFISENKTERACAATAVTMAEAAGYRPLAAAVSEGRTLKPGDKVWALAHGKALILVQLGAGSLTAGLNILGAHIDSPRLDVVVRGERLRASGHALLWRHQALPVGYAAACFAWRGGEDRRFRGGRAGGRRSGRPGILRDRFAHSPGEPADGQEGVGSR